MQRQLQELLISASNLGFYRGFKGSKGPVWKYFKFELDGSGQAVNVNRVVCLLCPCHTKRVAVEFVYIYYIYIYIYIYQYFKTVNSVCLCVTEVGSSEGGTTAQPLYCVCVIY